MKLRKTREVRKKIKTRKARKKVRHVRDKGTN